MDLQRDRVGREKRPPSQKKTISFIIKVFWPYNNHHPLAKWLFHQCQRGSGAQFDSSTEISVENTVVNSVEFLGFLVLNFYNSVEFLGFYDIYDRRAEFTRARRICAPLNPGPGLPDFTRKYTEASPLLFQSILPLSPFLLPHIFTSLAPASVELFCSPLFRAEHEIKANIVR